VFTECIFQDLLITCGI